jgi:protein-S-isoprenylcysteine O-methyltransferase Ste14
LGVRPNILIAIRLEEGGLMDVLGDDYRQYRARAPMIIPFVRAPRRAGPMR